MATTQVQVLRGRQVPLGGIRAMYVRRTLPHRNRSFVGAWCFVDHYGPDEIDPQTDPETGGGMDLPPHPHTGLQTVSWLFEGELEHRDSGGAAGLIRPGEVNLMTAGAGIAHSEVTTSGTTRLHGVQLWVALPQGERFRNADFAHHADLPVVEIGAVRATVMVGEFAGAASPAETFSPLVGAQVDLTGLATLPLQPDFEYAVLAVDADLTVDGQAVPRGALQYLGWGATHVQLAADPCARVLVLGGEPMTEDLLMWWNFVGRTHEEIVEARRDWEGGDDRFGPVPGDPNPRLPAPALPTVALKARPARR